MRTHSPFLALLITGLILANTAVHAAGFRNRDNPNASDVGDPAYPAPYHQPKAEEILATLNLIREYAESATVTRVIDSATRAEIKDPASAPVATAVADRGDDNAFAPWAYTIGVTDAGMLYAARVTGDARFAAFPQRHLQFVHDWLPYFKKQAEQFGIESGSEARGPSGLAQRNSFKGAILTETLDDSGSLGAAIVKARLAGVGPDLLPLIQQLADFVHTKQMRLADGTWARPRPQPVSLWADDYYMSIPFMAQMYKITGDKKYADDAVSHVLHAGERLFNPRTQLYTHGWNANQPYNPQFYWGRANGWVAMSLVELLDVLPADHPDRARILGLFAQHVQALASLQSPTGLWHNLLDKTDSYEESSCTAMFVYAIAHAINEGWISAASFGSVAQVGWNGLTTKINTRGQIGACCTGTTFASDNIYYYHRPTTPDGSHAIGPVLMAGAEMIRLLKNDKVQIKYQWRTYHYVPKE